MSEDRLRCLFCLEEIDRTDSPRLLPCGQIGCLVCIQGSLSQPCVCGLVHDINIIESLPSPPVTNKRPVDDSSGVPPPRKASRLSTVCDNCKNSAICYCVYCEKSLCLQHEDIHSKCFPSEKETSGKHKIISMEEYERCPNVFLRPRCQEHQEVLSMCCIKCYCMKCSLCTSTKNGDDKDGAKMSTSQVAESTEGQSTCQGDHVFASMKDTETRLKAEFEKLLQDCSDQITELCRREKSTWQKLDSLEDECEEMTKGVRAKTEQLMHTINKLGDKMIGTIEKWRCFARGDVERNLLEVRNFRDEYDNNRTSYHKFVADNHVTELVNHREALIESLEMDSSSLYEPNLWIQTLKCSIDDYKKLDFSSFLIPTAVEMVTAVAPKSSYCGPCKSLSFTDDNSLIALCSKNVMICPSIYSPTRWNYLYKGEISAVAATEEHIYFLDEREIHKKSVHQIDTANALASCASDQVLNMRELFTLDIPGGHATAATQQSSNSSSNPLRGLYVSRDYIIVVIGCKIVAYHKDSKEQCDIQITWASTDISIALCDVNSMLVFIKHPTGITEVLKYTIVTTDQGNRIDEQQIHGWINGVTDICPYGDEGYLVNVNSSYRLTSKEGKLLKELRCSHPAIPSVQMTVRGDVLATVNTGGVVGIYQLF